MKKNRITNALKFVFLYISILTFSFSVDSCTGLFRNVNTSSVEFEIAKIYAVNKLEQAFGVKIEPNRHFKASKVLLKKEFEKVFGENLTSKFTDSLSLTFENQKVRTSIIYTKLDSTKVMLNLDRKPK